MIKLFISGQPANLLSDSQRLSLRAANLRQSLNRVKLYDENLKSSNGPSGNAIGPQQQNQAKQIYNNYDESRDSMEF